MGAFDCVCMHFLPIDNLNKVMVYDSENGVYVFLFDSQDDKSCFADLWFEDLDEAVDY